MRLHAKLLSLVSVGALLGCALPWHKAPAESVSTSPRVQAVERLSGALSPVDSLVMMGRAAQGAGQVALAEERYAQALILQPQHPGALNAMAVLYAQSDRLEQAIDMFRRALALAPKSAHLHNNLGYALLLAGRQDQAQAEFKRAQEAQASTTQPGHAVDVLAKAHERSDTVGQLVQVEKNVYQLRDRAAPVAARQIAAAAEASRLDAPRQTVQLLQGVRLEVSNGVGIRLLARRTAERLATWGLVPARLTNQQKFQQPHTELQFGPEQANAAQALAAQLPFGVKTVATTGLIRNIQLRLVLGHDVDAKSLQVWLDRAAELRVALTQDIPWCWG